MLIQASSFLGLDQLQTVTRTGMPVARRISTASAAYKIYEDVLNAAEPLAILRAQVNAEFDGNAPLDQALLERLGQGARSNINWRELRSIIRERVEQKYSLIMDSALLIDARINPLTEIPVDYTQAHGWTHVVADEYTQLIKSWPGWGINLKLVLTESEKHGMGLLYWEDSWNWMPRALRHIGNFGVPTETEAEESLVTLCYLRDKMTPRQLFELLENRDIAVKEGWQPENIKLALIRIYGAGGTGQQDSSDKFQVGVWESLQQAYRNRDPMIEVQEYKAVRVIGVLCAEVKTGRVTVMKMLEEAEDDPRFLLYAPDHYESMRNAIWLLPMDYGDGYVRSLRGSGTELLSYGQASNRMLNSTLDSALLNSSILLQPKTAADAQKFNMIRVGPATLLPPGVDAVQSSFQPPILPLVQVRGMFRAIVENNTGTFRATPEDVPAKRQIKTARQVAEESANKAQQQQTDVNFMYDRFEFLHREIFRRLTNKSYIDSDLKYPGQEAAREFVERCVKRGVPRELLLDGKTFMVFVARALGAGSPSVRMDVTNQLMAARGSMDEVSQRYVEREWAAARVGWHNVDKVYPLRERDLLSSNQASIAALENNDFVEGRTVPVGGDQMHIVHFMVHSQAGIRYVQVARQAPQEFPLEEAINFFQAGLPNMQGHLQYLQRDPVHKARVMQFIKLFGLFGKFFQQLQRQAAQIAKAQEEAKRKAVEQQMEQMRGELTAENRIKMMEVQGKLQNEARKQESLNEMRQVKTQVQNQIKQQAAAQRAELERWQAEMSAMLEARVADAEIAIKQAKASAVA